MSQVYASVSQNIGASASVLPMNIQDRFPLGLTGLISLLSKGLSRVFSSTMIRKHQFFSTQTSLWSNSHIWTSLLEKPELWLYRTLWTKWCLCFLIYCLLLSRFSRIRLCNPIDGSPPGSPVLGILQARTLEWVAISFSNAWKWKVKVKLLSRIWPSATPWTAAYQAPPPMGFSRQESWSGLPLSFLNTLSRFLLAFLPRSKHLLISLHLLQSTIILFICTLYSSPTEDEMVGWHHRLNGHEFV